MASENVAEWIANNIGHAGDEILELGSKRYKDHAYLNLRDLLSSAGKKAKLTGCDIAEGENVDVVLDLTASFDEIYSALGGRSFDTIFCISLLEHIPDVFGASRNVERLLRTGGAIYISVPFVFRYHGYPGDLWRFTPEAICFLFPSVDFRGYKYSCVSTLEERDTLSLSKRNMEKMNRFLFRPKSREEKLDRKRIKLEGGVVPAYSLAPAMINMIGFKK